MNGEGIFNSAFKHKPGYPSPLIEDLGFVASGPPIQHIAQFLSQFCLRNRLLNELDAFLEAPLMYDRIPRITRHEEDAQLWAQRLGMPRQMPPVHPGHDDVGQHKIDLGVGAI